jgi:hypothetical protein
MKGSSSDEDDFWGGPTVRQALEAERQAERKKFAQGWHRNALLAIALMAILIALWFALR